MLLRHCLIVLGLSACAGAPKFPEAFIYEFDPKEPVCAEYKITDVENFKYIWVRDIPFAQCPAIFGFTPVQVPNVFNWGIEVRDYSKKHCQ